MRQAPVPDLREFGQTDKPEAEEAKMAEKYMKESTEPNRIWLRSFSRGSRRLSEMQRRKGGCTCSR